MPPLKGGVGGDPLNFLKLLFTKSCLITISIKSLTKNDVLFTKLGAIIISGRVNETQSLSEPHDIILQEISH